MPRIRHRLAAAWAEQLVCVAAEVGIGDALRRVSALAGLVGLAACIAAGLDVMLEKAFGAPELQLRAPLRRRQRASARCTWRCPRSS